MDLKKICSKTLPLFQKYKYVLLILLVGIILMLIPGNQKDTQAPEPSVSSSQEQRDIAVELGKMLSMIQGAGEVRVMLSTATGWETVYQTNTDFSQSENTTDKQIQVITVTDNARNENGLIKQINPPKYLGAIIVCQGANDPAVVLALKDATAKITGLGTDKIAVLKMK